MRETVVRLSGSKFYYVKSDADIDAERTAACCSLLYSRIASSRFPEDTLVTITKRRGVDWPHWGKKPTHLVEGLATISGIPRIIMFVHDASSRVKEV